MTDREMLELAARAAGYVVESHHISGGAWVYPVGEVPDADGDYPGLFLWNPREHDGDALRLAVKLELILCVRREGVTDATMHAPRTGMTPYLSFLEQHKDDPYAATRRAITRAAAEIGRQMEETSND